MKAIIDRLIQVRPKVLFADNAYQYKGKLYSCVSKASNVASELRQKANLEHTVLVMNVPGSALQEVEELEHWYGQGSTS